MIISCLAKSVFGGPCDDHSDCDGVGTVCNLVTHKCECHRNFYHDSNQKICIKGIIGLMNKLFVALFVHIIVFQLRIK